MNYLAASVRQLRYALEVYRRAEAGGAPPEMLKLGGNPNEALFTLADNVLMSFGSTAITLNRCCEEMLGIDKTPRLQLQGADRDFAIVVYQIRNAVAHDASEPRWRVSPGYPGVCAVGPDVFDLKTLNGEPFEYAHINGLEGFFRLVEHGNSVVWANRAPLGDRRFIKPA